MSLLHFTQNKKTTSSVNQQPSPHLYPDTCFLSSGLKLMYISMSISVLGAGGCSDIYGPKAVSRTTVHKTCLVSSYPCLTHPQLFSSSCHGNPTSSGRRTRAFVWELSLLIWSMFHLPTQLQCESQQLRFRRLECKGIGESRRVRGRRR